MNILEIPTVSEAEYKQLEHAGVFVVVFTAHWNAPGQRMVEELMKVKDKVAEKAKIVKVDIEETPEIPINLKISTYPTTLIFSKGDLKENLIGVVSEQKICNLIDSLI